MLVNDRSAVNDTDTVGTADYEDFVASNAGRLRQLLVARYGIDVGAESTADALAYAAEHWDRVGRLDSPLAYLYRVAQSSSRRYFRWQRNRADFPGELRVTQPSADAIELLDLLGTLTEMQRTSVVMIHAHGWTYAETADALGISVAAVTNHVHRGLARLRALAAEEQR
jgi:DNA-directed RNA polymerase specialized sigma24 family protein